MTERPILFSGEMVRVILDGRKTQTRRVVKLPVIEPNFGCELAGCEIGAEAPDLCPYGRPDDWLWVKETWGVPYKTPDPKHPRDIIYFANPRDASAPVRKRPAIFMPRWASRITLKIRDIWAERVQDISFRDCEAEGLVHAGRAAWTCPGTDEIFYEGYEGFRWLWDSINGKTYPWKKNPWVWVIEFRRL